MIIELTDAELGLLERATRQTAIRFWGEARASSELAVREDRAIKAIFRTFSDNADKMRGVFLKIAAARRADHGPISLELTDRELVALEVSLREPIIRQLGESALYLVDQYHDTRDTAFRSVMSAHEGDVARRLIELSVKLRKMSALLGVSVLPSEPEASG